MSKRKANPVAKELRTDPKYRMRVAQSNKGKKSFKREKVNFVKAAKSGFYFAQNT